MKFSVYIATSLDGFIARKDGGIDWLMEAGTSNDSEDYGFKEFFKSVDCMIMGRNSMEMALSFPEWPYEGKKVIVLSNTMKNAPQALSGKVEMYSGPLDKLVEDLEVAGYARAYVDGGKTIQTFINASLIDDLSITKIPVLLGEGLPLFGKTHRDIKLNHIETSSYPNGFVHSTYEITNG